MMLVKLVEQEDGSIKAETPRKVIGYFEDMTVQEVREYLARRAAEADIAIRFVDDFEVREPPLNVRSLMRGGRRK